MSMHILLTGTFHKDPIQRTSQNGKAFVTAILRIEQEGGTVWANVICFDDQAKAELLRCNAGDTVAVQGKLKVGVYERNGEHRPSLHAITHGVLQTKPKPARPAQEAMGQTARGQDIPFNDEIAF